MGILPFEIIGICDIIKNVCFVKILNGVDETWSFFPI